MELEKKLDEKINYFYEMLEKYDKLNDKCKGRYGWRIEGIQVFIEALEELKENENIRTWDECYEEDLEESERL